MNKICIFLAPGFEEIEALTVVDLLRRANLDTLTVSISDDKRVTSSHNITVEADTLLTDIDFDTVTMLVLPGGMPGTTNLEACEPLMAQVEKFYKEGKSISAICAAPSILGHRGMLRGRTACSFPDFESHLEGAAVTQNPVEVSEHIITSRGMGCAIDFGLAIVAKLKGNAEAEALADKIIYKRG